MSFEQFDQMTLLNNICVQRDAKSLREWLDTNKDKMTIGSYRPRIYDAVIHHIITYEQSKAFLDVALPVLNLKEKPCMGMSLMQEVKFNCHISDHATSKKIREYLFMHGAKNLFQEAKREALEDEDSVMHPIHKKTRQE
jgi:hypothetical protein